MNYVGSISIIDRGDAPAKAIIDKNTRSLAQRVADETKEELDKVMDRVDNIYVSYEMSTQTMFENPRGSPNVEYIEDIKELEEILTDKVKKKKYQQQVTVFVVGFQDVCAQKMQLLQQVNQFFLDNSKLDEDELVEDKPEIDLEEASNKVNESLSTAEELAKKLSDLNQDIIEWLVNYANTKASNKGKKRLEKSLDSAKNELSELSEKLLKLQTELEEKDEKFQQVAKQLEAKTQEAVRYKTAAEVAKKSAQDNEAHTSVLQDEITRRDEKIIELRTKLSRLEINLTESQFDKDMSTRKLDNAQAQTKEKLAKLQEEVELKKMAVGDAEREMDKLHRDQLASLHKSHQQEIEELKKEHEEEIAKLTDEVLSLQEQMTLAERQALEADGHSEELRAKLIELQLREPTKDNIEEPVSRESSARLSGKSIGELSASEDEHPSRQDSRQSNKDTKKKAESLKPTKVPSKSPNRNIKDKAGRKDFADASIQDDGGDVAKAYVEKSNEQSRQATRQSKNLETVIEGDGTEFPNAFDLDDEESWAGVPPQNIQGRFLQYRQLGRAKIKELEEQLQMTLTKTHRKVNSLKSQFNEHKGKWEAERKVLIEQVEQAQKLQTDAEKEADAAMTQLEEFINEQEKLEDEEEQKRQEIIKTMSRPGTVKGNTPAPTQSKEGKSEEQGQGDGLQTENSEQELKNLMQQTDDAKSRAGSSLSHSKGAGSPVAPWMTPAADQKVETKKRVTAANKSNSESRIDDLTSRLTSVADAEIQNILPVEDGADTKMSSVTIQEFPKAKGEILPAIGGVKGERERLMSRTSSKGSRKPKIRSSSHLTEQEEEETDDEDVAPWLRDFGKPKVQVYSDSSSSDSDSLEYQRDASKELRQRSSSLKDKEDESSELRKGSSSQEEDKELSPEQIEKLKSTEIERKSISQNSKKSYTSEKEKNATPWFHKLGKPEAQSQVPPRTPVSKQTDRSSSQLKEKHDSSNEIRNDSEAVEVEIKEDLRPRSQRSLELQSRRSRRSSMKEDDEDEENDVQLKQKVKKKVKQKPQNNDQALTRNHANNEISFVKQANSNERKTELSKEQKVEAKSKKKSEIDSDKKKIYEAYKKKRAAERKRKQGDDSKEVKKVQIERRTSSAKVPKEFQERLNKEMEKMRKIKSSFGHVDEMASPIISDADSDDERIEPDIEEIGLEIEKDAHLGKSPFVQEDGNVPDLKSRMTVQPSVQSRSIQNSRMTQQSLKSVSLAMELDLDDNVDDDIDDVFKTEDQTQSLEVQDHNLEEEVPDTEDQGKRSRGQDLTSDGQHEKTEVSGPEDEIIGPESEQQNTQDSITAKAVEPAGLSIGDKGGENVVKSHASRSVHEGNEGEKLRDKDDADIVQHQQEVGKDLESGELIAPEIEEQDIRDLMLESNRGIMTDEEKANFSRMTSVKETPRYTVSVNILHTPGEDSLLVTPTESQAQKNARQTGAISAPPAVEPDDAQAQKLQQFEILQEDFESKPVTSREKTSVSQSEKHLDDQKPMSPPKQAFRTPRSVRSRNSQSEMSADSMSFESDPDEGVAMDLAPSQSEALSNLKSMMAEDNLNLEQQKTLESLRSAIRSLSAEQALRDVQLERTVTILSLASQIAQESVELGVLPDSVFDSFSKAGSRAISAVSGQRSVKGSAMSRLNVKSEKVEEEPSVIKPGKDIEFHLVKQKKSKSSKVTKPAAPQDLDAMPVKDTKITTNKNQEYSKGVKPEQKKLKEKVVEPVEDYSHSGSVMADFLSSRGDSFSASLPRTLTSSEWRRLSPHDPFSPNAEKKQKQEKEKELPKALTPADLDGAETKMSSISVVISPKKKSRPVTMQQMLYGEGKLEIAPAEVETANDLRNADILPRSRSARRSRPSPEKKLSPIDQKSVTVSRASSLTSLENNVSSKSEIQTDQSDLVVNDLPEESIDSAKEIVNFEDHLAQLPSDPHITKVTKFQCLSKVLTLEIEREHKNRPAVKGNILKAVKTQADPIFSREDKLIFSNFDKFSRVGNNYDLEKQTKSKRQPSRSRSFTGLSKSRSVSTAHVLGESVPGKGSLSNRLSLLANRNKYNVGSSEFLNKTILSNTDKMPSRNIKSPKENLFPPNWKFRNDNVAIATATNHSDLQNVEVKEATSQELESLRELIQEEATAKSTPHSRSSRSSHKASRLSAKSKQSAPRSASSVHSELQQPKSPSTLSRVSPDTINRTSPVTINRSPRTTATPGTMVSEVQRPVSISSVQPRICDSPPPLLHKSPPPYLHKETQTDDWLAQIEHEPVSGNTEDEVRQSSAKSRASLRNQFKSRLDETRQAVEERRTKSPIITVPALNLSDELIIDDDDDLPIPDDLKEEVFQREDTLDAGTSPPPSGKQDTDRKISVASRKSTNLAEHPVVGEYLRAYTGIHNFKEAMSRVLVDKDQMSASQILTDLDVMQFNKDEKVVPQISNMTENIYYVLNEVSQVINSVLQNDRGPVVSSLMMGMSRDATQRTIMREKSGATADMLLETRASQRTASTKAGSVSTDAAQYQELQAQYEKLQNQMSEDGKKYEEQQRHNVVVMMEMQDTINQLQRELSALGKQTRRPMSESVSTAGVQNADSAIMFTRLDSERNAKIMKKAVNERKLDPSSYKEAMVQMDEYVNLPAQRLAHLVRKYVHHCRMKEIEENVQKSHSLNENVFELFDKMEALQNQRAKRWAERMDEMGIERYRLANMLMETLDSIEQESGLFLIKPMYSYRGREPKEKPFSGKITRPFRPHRTLSPLRDNNSAHAPAPTPASNVRPRNMARYEQYSSQNVGQSQYEVKGPLEGDSTGLMGSSVGYMAAQPGSTWKMSDSQLGINNPYLGNVNTPRILELDINRMMIGQNTISAQIGSQGLSNDRLVNAANNNLRAYMTVNRPGPNSAGRSDRPHSGSRQTTRPSSSPTNHSASTAKRVRLSDVEIPTVMSQNQPLPPIGVYQESPRSGSGKGRQSPPRIPVGSDLPESPPGSSLRHTPPGMEDIEVTSPVK